MIRTLLAQDSSNQIVKWGRGEVLTSSAAVTSFGVVLATVSERGLCSVALGTDAAELREEVWRRFPDVRVVDGTFKSEAERAAAAVAREIESPTGTLDLPLDIRGTDFQRRVWQALFKIPIGATVTYTELAATVGTPRAVRAVGAACGANRLAVVVPCHRAVGSNGSLTGYRWGVEWKRELLEREVRVR